MRKAALVGLVAAIGALMLAASPAAAWHRWHGGVFIDVGPWWIPPPRYYVAPPPAVIVEPPPVYVQQAPTQPAQESYWYYCASKQGYYPYVPSCPEPWVPVPARPPQ
ncbi:MAG TPA: hypothetical protein VNU03_17810 [Methylomirabilota bacterium]|jgi:hypothetical protein|nr:hypothetical protein [Methylomirabilota bacterium]